MKFWILLCWVGCGMGVQAKFGPDHPQGKLMKKSIQFLQQHLHKTDDACVCACPANREETQQWLNLDREWSNITTKSFPSLFDYPHCFEDSWEKHPNFWTQQCVMGMVRRLLFELQSRPLSYCQDQDCKTLRAWLSSTSRSMECETWSPLAMCQFLFCSRMKT